MYDVNSRRIAQLVDASMPAGGYIFVGRVGKTAGGSMINEISRIGFLHFGQESGKHS